MNITFFGTYDTQNTPRVQVLIEGLQAHGVNVAECNVPLPVNTSQRVAILRQPWRLPLLAFAILRCWAQLIRSSRRMPHADAVIIGHLGQFDIHLARFLFRGKPLILDYLIAGSDTGQDRQIQGDFKHRLLTWLDKAALKKADIVVVDTEEHRQRLPKAYRSKGVQVLVGAPEAWFEAAKPSKTSGKDSNRPLKVVFFGAYIPLQGAPTIAASLRLLKQPIAITMIGGGQELVKAQRAAIGISNTVSITWRGWVDTAELPDIIAEYDVCLGIFGTGPKAQRVVPNKVYQGAAAGCAIVTADTSPQRRVLGETALFVPAGDPQALASTLDRLATDRPRLTQLRRAVHQLAEQAFTPREVIIPLLERIKSLN